MTWRRHPLAFGGSNNADERESMILSVSAVYEALYSIFYMPRERRLLSPVAADLAATHCFCSYFTQP